MKDKKDLCALDVFRECWKVLSESTDLEEAKKKFRELTLKLVLEGNK